MGPVRAAYMLELVDPTGGQNGFTEVVTCPVSMTLATESGIDLGDAVGCNMLSQHDISC